MESQEIPHDKKVWITHSLVHEERSWSQREIEKNDRDGRRRTRARAIVSMRKRKSQLSREFLSILRGLLSLVRVSHLAESESPGWPCNDAQVHAEQDSLFASPALRLLHLSFSLPFHLLLVPPPPLPSPSSSSSSSAQQAAARQGRAPSPLPLSGFFGPLAPPRRPSKTPQSRRQLLTSPPRTPSPPSSFPPSSFSHLFHLFVLPRRAFSPPTLLF